MLKKSKKKYEIVRGAISYDLANFIFNYLLLHRDATAFLMHRGIVKDIGPSDLWGTWKDKQIPNTFSKYGDGVLDTLLMKVLPVMRKLTGLSLIPCYSYVRLYKTGDELVRHRDRKSCEVSYTLFLGGDPWEFFLDPTGKSGVKTAINPHAAILKKKPNKGLSVLLKPGDMLVYRGCELDHWRKPFKGALHAAAFGHYNDSDGPEGRKRLFDGRPVLGIPSHDERNEKWPTRTTTTIMK